MQALSDKRCTDADFPNMLFTILYIYNSELKVNVAFAFCACKTVAFPATNVVPVPVNNISIFCVVAFIAVHAVNTEALAPEVLTAQSLTAEYDNVGADLIVVKN